MRLQAQQQVLSTDQSRQYGIDYSVRSMNYANARVGTSSHKLVACQSRLFKHAVKVASTGYSSEQHGADGFYVGTSTAVTFQGSGHPIQCSWYPIAECSPRGADCRLFRCHTAYLGRQ